MTIAIVTSIKQSAIETPAPGYSPRLPNFCNLGVMLRLLVLVNLLCVAAAIVKIQTPRDFVVHYLTLSVVVQPALILSMLMLCGARRWIARLSYAQELVVALGAEAAIGGVSFLIMRSVLPGASQLPLWQFVFFYAFVTATVLFYFDMRSRALSPALTEARLQALQSRIRPHFLFNSMNAALSLIRSEPKRAERVLENMAELFRGLMNENRQLVRLDEEVNLCLNYLEIEQIRLGERLKVTWKIEAMPANALVPPLILQPLIENAVYHGVEPLGEAGEISIEIAERGRELVITLINPIPSSQEYSDSATHNQGNRMAISNIRERLQLHFDAEARLKTETENGLYRVTIVLPNLDREP
jgi:two-component system, LytTR family, sensor histidine kinase AlgZ